MTAPADGTGPDAAGATRTATVRTGHEDPATIAAAVAPDNTGDMQTRVKAGTILTTIERGDAGGLQSTVDDYVVNVDIAETVAGHAAGFRRRRSEHGTGEHRPTEHRSEETDPEHRREGTDTNG